MSSCMGMFLTLEKCTTSPKKITEIKDWPLSSAIEQALSYGCVHLDGVLHCLRQLTDVKEPTTSLDLSDRPDLDKVGNQPVDLSRYERLLKYTW